MAPDTSEGLQPEPGASESPAAGQGASRLGRLALIIGAAVALDQATKQWAHHHVRGRGVVAVVEGLFDLRYSRNPGAFFSIGAGWPDAFRRLFFVVASLIATGLIVGLYRRTQPEQRALRGGLLLLLAGAIGNLIDRIRAGEVIDFLHLHWYETFHWATFNVADIYIALGLVLLVADMWHHKQPHGHRAETKHGGG